MIFGLYGSNRSFVLGFLALPVLAFAILAFFFSAPVHDVVGGPVYQWVYGFLAPSKIGLLAIGSLVHFGSAVLINAISNGHNFNSKENYFPALLYILMVGFDLEGWYFNPFSTGLLFLLLALRRLLTLFRAQRAISPLYDAGLFIALAVLFYPPLLLLAPVLWIAPALLRSFELREWMVPLAGLITPCIYLFAVIFLFDYQIPWDDYITRGSEVWSVEVATWKFWEWTLTVLTVLMFVLGVFKILSVMSTSTVHLKNSKKIFIWTAVLLIATFFYAIGLEAEKLFPVALLALPFSVAMGEFFVVNSKRFWASILFYVWLVAALASPVFGSVF